MIDLSHHPNDLHITGYKTKPQEAPSLPQMVMWVRKTKKLLAMIIFSDENKYMLDESGQQVKVYAKKAQVHLFSQ
jgi:hypothetical protein